MAAKEKDEKSLIDSIKLILGKEDKIKQQLENDRGLERYTNDLLLLMSLVKDYYQGNYRNIPYKTISAGVVGLLYLINPIDIIPDFIPFIGQIDDALVLKFCLKLMEKDLVKYKNWKNEQTASKETLLKETLSKDAASKSSTKKLEDKSKDTKDKEESKK
ncbi:YkvA family protein [Psychrobacter glacincola]|uniref:YkvA family protein n=1 Tax=Psychrobacter glacincola TaxID=56810 RepID=UPI0039B0004B